MSFYMIDGNKVILLKKYKYESIVQFVKRIEIYNKAINKSIDNDKAIMLSVAYTNKLKYNIKYNSLVENEISLIAHDA